MAPFNIPSKALCTLLFLLPAGLAVQAQPVLRILVLDRTNKQPVTFATRLLNFSFSGRLNWNWVGKTASFAWALTFIYSNRLLTKKETGWSPYVHHPRSIWRAVAALVLLRLLLRMLFSGAGGGYDPETLLYEATLPGLSEEIVYRGILLALLNRVYVRRFTFLGTSFGWGLILTSLLFGAIHGVSLSASWIPGFSSQRFIMTAAFGFVLGLIRERSQSLLPGMALHNLWNIIAYWGK